MVTPQLTRGGPMSPLVPDYARRPINEGFDWPAILQSLLPNRSRLNWRTILRTLLTERRLRLYPWLYRVAFSSQQRPDADLERLRLHDERAHAEAQRSPALLYYFAGNADEHGYCLSFCLWTDIKAARAVTSHAPHHQAAVGIADQMYTSFGLERDIVHFTRRGEVRIRPVRSPSRRRFRLRARPAVCPV